MGRPLWMLSCADSAPGIPGYYISLFFVAPNTSGQAACAKHRHAQEPVGLKQTWWWLWEYKRETVRQMQVNVKALEGPDEGLEVEKLNPRGRCVQEQRICCPRKNTCYVYQKLLRG